MVHHSRIQKWGTGSRDSDEQTLYGSSAILVWNEATKPAFNVGPSSAIQRYGFWILTPPTKKSVVFWILLFTISWMVWCYWDRNWYKSATSTDEQLPPPPYWEISYQPLHRKMHYNIHACNPMKRTKHNRGLYTMTLTYLGQIDFTAFINWTNSFEFRGC